MAGRSVYLKPNVIVRRNCLDYFATHKRKMIRKLTVLIKTANLCFTSSLSKKNLTISREFCLSALVVK